ncbi:hypothetical protein BOTBODRAFT_58766 [Botryobasidium botryosum FD-172 SS1]|uniref:PPM-type phosphatase domain-containing protein n=1 Tax=Botryobasidium botryosum (strain FD-172 SS1) TaxID=930990 RepID=A0A067M134_BOTB1|nr:hypothetical protein BOTBODRAFT_58766 [Botryobasidium botryosum FD-172 SS1]
MVFPIVSHHVLAPTSWQRLCRLPLYCHARSFCDYLRYPISQHRNGRVPLHSPKVVGTAVSRGNRPYQEDSHTVAAIRLDPEELRPTIERKLGLHWNPRKVDSEYDGQFLFAGIYDGHGGPTTSEYLKNELHGWFENVNKSQIPMVISWAKEFGGYFKRFTGGILAPLANGTDTLNLETRATLAFLEADRNVCELQESYKSGATASVVLLHPLESPYVPFYLSHQLVLTVAHCGDTRVLLCSTDSGTVTRMTEVHHADTHSEAARLRRMAGGLVTDSFGESRWMGALENTRGLGDVRFKPFGVTPEPEIRTKLLRGSEWAYIVMVSDGISSILSDQEIVDLARDAPHPQSAAQSILKFAEELGSEDNASVLVIPLAGWGSIRGPDKTKELREYRSRQAVGSERQRRT